MSSDREDSEGDGEEPGDASPSSSTPSPPPGARKRSLSSTSSRSSVPLDPFRGKTQDLPNIYNCHSCGLRFPDRGRREHLQPLDSQWRIVVLCGACLQAVRSGEVCSYCFVSLVEENEGFISCRKCSCRVHLNCRPKQRGYLTASDLDPDLFVCVDCCACPLSPTRKCSDIREPCGARVSRVSLEDVVRDAKCAAERKVALAANAKEKALAKAVAAKGATERARTALNLVVLAEDGTLVGTEGAVPDEELALRLHRAMNGSQRISRNPCPEKSDCLIDTKRGEFNANSLGKDPESRDSAIYGKVELCAEDTLFDTIGIIGAEHLDVLGSPEENCNVHINARKGRDQKKEVDKNGKGNPEETSVMEELGSSFDMLVSNIGDDKSVNFVSAPCPNSSGPNATLYSLQQDQKCHMPDRYVKKYCKRPSRMKDEKENGGSASLLVPVGQQADP